MDLSGWIGHRAAWSPDQVALHFDGEDVTYAALASRVRRLADALASVLGVARGDRVAHLGFNSPGVLELLFACARLGAMLVPLNWRLAPAEHAAILADAEPAAVFVEPALEAALGPALAARPELRVVRCRAGDHAALLGDAPPAAAAGAPEAPVLLVYTSGTTGRPKGALLTQEALLYNALNGIAAHQMTAADHVLTVLPMFHVGGLNIHTTPALYAGATVTIARRFDAGDTLRLIGARRPTLLLTVPTVAQALAEHPAFPATDLGSLRLMATGAQVVPEAVIRPWLAHGVPVVQVYGLTESGPTAIALPLADAWRKPTACGLPALHTEARIAAADGGEAPRGQRGEIQLRGPNLTAGYWRNAEATRLAFTGGWFHTGDVGHQDAEGYFYVDDRQKDVVITGGENVYPAELEQVLADCPAIAEAAVVGRPDARWGEVPVACVVLRPGAGLDGAGVLALFEGRVARFKHPRDVVFLDTLPRTAMGKVQKFELRDRLRGAAAPAPDG